MRVFYINPIAGTEIRILREADGRIYGGPYCIFMGD